MNIERLTSTTIQNVQNTTQKATSEGAFEPTVDDGKLLNALNGLASSNCALIQKTKPLTFEEKLKIALEKGISESFAPKFASLNDTQFEKAQELLHLRKRIEQENKARNDRFKGPFPKREFTTFSIADAFNFAQLEPERYELAKAMLSKEMHGDRVDFFIKLEEEDFQKAKKLFNLGLSYHDIKEYYKADVAILEKINHMRQNGAGPSYIKEFLDFDEEQYKKALSLCRLGIPNYYAKDIARFDDATYQKAINLRHLGAEPSLLKNLCTLEDIQYQRTEFMLKKGIDSYLVDEYMDLEEREYRNFIELLDNGYDYSTAKKTYLDSEKTRNLIQKAQTVPNPMRDLLNSETYSEKLKKATQGRYQEEVYKMLHPETMTFATKKSLLESGLNEKDYFASVQKLSKSTFKKALKVPNQYLSNIDIRYTTKINGKYPTLTEEELQSQQKEIATFISQHIGEILRAGKYLDCDTINQMMDKRTEIFAETLEELNKLTEDSYSLLSKLIKGKTPDGKALTAKDKIDLSQIVGIFQEAKLDPSLLVDMANSGEINIAYAKAKIKEIILNNAGITQEQLANIPAEKLQFSEDYTYLILKKSDEVPEELTDDNLSQEISDAKEKAKMQNNPLYTIVRESVLGDFQKFITDTSNIYGQANLRTKEAFEELNLDYEKWLKPEIKDVEVNVGDKKMTIKMWERNPQEDLFIGNKTTCCTAIGREENSGSTPLYLLNTSFNVVELYDEKGNVVGMSRVFMGKINDEPSLMMDNIELNKTYTKGMSQEELAKIRNGFFDYMNQYSQQVTKNPDSQVYFSTNFAKVPTRDLRMTKQPTEFVGNISQDSIYINAQGNICVLEEMGDEDMEWFVVPKFNIG